jgi:hypothetical protein
MQPDAIPIQLRNALVHAFDFGVIFWFRVACAVPQSFDLFQYMIGTQATPFVGKIPLTKIVPDAPGKNKPHLQAGEEHEQ